jgi:hypothetical protein
MDRQATGRLADFPKFLAEKSQDEVLIDLLVGLCGMLAAQSTVPPEPWVLMAGQTFDALHFPESTTRKFNSRFDMLAATARARHSSAIRSGSGG